ncbi:hypothetical protein AMJ57_01290 [Parcubacteria bacterium SG8_24]|nr:MAG: hypothetical protein AMJ57_01290 [Parcubacteria bacterium SG8_24]
MATSKPKPKRKILIIDDEPALLDIYSTQLNLAGGFEPITADDGVRGMQLALKELPDLIVLDIMMPLKDGFEVLKDLKSRPVTRDIPVIILSNLGQQYEIKHGLSMGAERYLVKADMSSDDLVNEIVSVFSEGEKKG